MHLTLSRITFVVAFAFALMSPQQAGAQAAPAKPATPTTVAVGDPIDKPWTGDFDGMVKRRRIRILTPYSKTHYFIDRGVQRGIVFEAGTALETALNKKLKTGLDDRLHVVFVPTSRDELLQSLIDGRGDIIASPITITPERQKLADFTTPTWRGVKEVLVTGPGASIVTTSDDLSGKIVSVRVPSIYAESLEALNVSLKQRGKAPVAIRALPASLEDEDILEMVNAGLVKATVALDFTARFWKQVLPSITVHDTIALREGADLGWVVRKGSPKLLAELNPLVAAASAGSAARNMAMRKYLQNTKFVKSATSEADMAKFKSMVELFRKYGQQYDMDFLLMLAQGYQESQLNNDAKSHVGALGVMQIMPATGAELKVGDIRQLEANVNGGVKYMRKLIDTYFPGDEMSRLDKGLMAFASYNAGPGRIRTLRKEAESRGLNPNVWFNNVERVVAEKVGRETVNYVSNIYKYYVAYTLTMEEIKAKAATRATVK
jgi:membrane-bound lytic murein transglycosylase MltF